VEIAPEALTRLEEVMEESGATTAFATGYLAQHSPLAADFAITPAILDDFKVYLGERNIQPSTAEWSSELPWIRSRLMEEIVTQARGVAAGDQIADQRDVQVQAAIEALRNTDLLKAAAP
jgi:carboxyl-terminal processing protease